MTRPVIAPGFTGATLDRADRLRHDSAALAAALADSRARLLRLDGLDPQVVGNRLTWGTLAEADPEDSLVLLGFEGEVPHFAAVRAGMAPVRGRPQSLMALLDALPAAEAALYAAARSVVDWHLRHRFCAVCGQATAPFRAGWARKCPQCGAEHFPRVDPVVIMLAEHGDCVLLGRQPGWPPGRYSALAGFVEPGESIEEAVARETLEEAGIAVRDVRYVASQPWPFPSSLMIACIAQARDDAITLDANELEEAFWCSRSEVRAAMAGDPGARFLPPPRYAIAHTLLSAWLDD